MRGGAASEVSIFRVQTPLTTFIKRAQGPFYKDGGVHIHLRTDLQYFKNFYSVSSYTTK